MRLLVLTFVIFFFGPVGGQERYTVIIQEIMADPSPAVGLPSQEWIEIRNRSTTAVNLQGWRIQDSNSSSGAMPARWLQPDSLLIICGTAALPLMAVFGPAMSVASFPSLDNEGELISLTDAAGFTIHAVKYDVKWHGNDLKREGGWSLEMIDPQFPCKMKGNWASATDITGGTPGRYNSVNGKMNAGALPRLLHAYSIDSVTARLVFDQPVDSLGAASVAAYSITGLSVLWANPVRPLFAEVDLTVQPAMQVDVLYQVKANGLRSCDGGLIETQTIKLGLPSAPGKGSLLINEVLFNPLPSGYDYVELIHTGKQVIDLSNCWLANRSSQGILVNMVKLSANPLLSFPGDYYVATADPNRLALHYFSSAMESIHTLPSMPSFPDDKGHVVLTDATGAIIDELPYSEKWHFPLIKDREGVALERIDSTAPASEAQNWRSAASTVGYGTPGYRNSQAGPHGGMEGTISVKPPVFSPDNDGREDQCFIYYELPAPGYVAEIKIYNLHGRLVRRLKQGSLLAASGFWTWDGLDEKGQANPPGPYIILTTVFNLEGRTGKWKSVVVLAAGPK